VKNVGRLARMFTVKAEKVKRILCLLPWIVFVTVLLYVASILLCLLWSYETCSKNVGNVASLPLVETKHFL